jgi:hydroxypyruvate isomerase
MRRFALNVSILYQELPFLERFAAARRAGFDAVEFWWPREEYARGMTPEDLAREVTEADVEVVLMNFDGGDLKAGDRGLVGDPDRAEAFRANVPLALEIAERLGCRKLNALTGKAISGIPLSEQLALVAANVAFAADLAAASGMSVMLEALNPVDTPGYLLPNTGSVLAMLERIGRANVRFQLDVYHVVMAGEDPIAAIRSAGAQIGHVQFADVPGRHEPGTGEVSWPAVLRALADVGYEEAIGLEYVASDPAAPDFAYLEQLRLAEPHSPRIP